MSDHPTTSRPVVLTIAGSDSCGGAGIQADLKTFAILGCHGASAITAITAQNTRGVQAVTRLDRDLIVQQIDAVADDLPIAALKTGMLGSAPIVAAVADAIERRQLSPLVVDPVMIAKSRAKLIDDDAINAIMTRLLPLATLVTPNRFEAQRLVGFDVDTVGEATRAAEVICDQFHAAACVVKGIRAERAGQPVAMDLFYQCEDQPHAIVRPWRDDGNSHGSGCTFSAAVAAHLARGLPLRHAMESARSLIDAAINSPVRLGGGVSCVDHLAIVSPTGTPASHL